jgi:hypothetical protein
MNAKRLEMILAGEFATGESEMVQRFQKLRDCGLLPVSRGRNAEGISRDHAVSGLLSVVSHRPSSAGVAATMLRDLVPVGGSETGFAGASTLAQALRLALADRALLDSLVEIRLTENKVHSNAVGRASIFFVQRQAELATYYVQRTATSLLQPDAERTYDPMDLSSAVIRETVIAPRLLRHIAWELARDEARALEMAATP